MPEHAPLQYRRLARGPVGEPQIALRWGGADWVMLADRALWWPAQSALIVADAHFGKAATFRARGIPVPAGTTTANLARLDRLVTLTSSSHLILLGDFFHAAEAHAAATIRQMLLWRQRHAALNCILVEGNHDLKAGPPPAALGLQVEPEPWALAGIRFAHHPMRVGAGPLIAGHVHPGIVIRGRSAESLRLPCFWWRDGLAVLPAFGDFTGSAAIIREPGDRVDVVADQVLYTLPRLKGPV